MKLIRRKSFSTFTTIESKSNPQFVKVIDSKSLRKVLVRNPNYKGN